MSKFLFSDGYLSKQVTNVWNLARLHGQQYTTKSVSHIDTVPTVYFSNILAAAIAIAKGLVGVATVEDDEEGNRKEYYEVHLEDGNVIQMLTTYCDDVLTSIAYEGAIDFEDATDIYPIVCVLIRNMLDVSEGNKELKSTIRQLVVTDTKDDEDLLAIICDNIVCRLANRTKKRLDIDIEAVEKTRGINLNDGTIYTIAEDLTDELFGINDFVFETLVSNSETIESKTTETKLFKGNYKFDVELTDQEKLLVPNIDGAVARFEYEDVLDTIFYTKDYKNPMNLIFATGPSGCGKSFMSLVIASELGLPYLSLSLDESFGTAMIKGNWQLGNKDGAEETFFKLSTFAERVQRPGVIELAECNGSRPEVLTLLYDLLDKDKLTMIAEDGRVIKRHPHCYIVMTCNMYACMNPIAKSLPARMTQIVRLPKMDRASIRGVLFKQIDGAKIDSDIVERVLDSFDAIEYVLADAQNGRRTSGVRIPKDCESSMRAYGYWMQKIQISRDLGRYDPIYAAKTTILPVISSGAGFNEDIEEMLIRTVIAPKFDVTY